MSEITGVHPYATYTKERPMTDYRDLIPVIVEREQATLPASFDSWGIKSAHPDLRTYGGYRWPFPGSVAECDPTRIVHSNRGACPSQPGDGLCVGLSWRGMAWGGIPARTLLLVAYRAADVLGEDAPEGKLRCPRVAVVALVDGERLLREAGAHADLRGADLGGADLRDADLRHADLRGAHLRGAHLGGADLGGAHLGGAHLGGADLRDADLRHADLRGAHLRGADLRDADLRHADLRRADLWGADYLWTRWPAGFDPDAAGAVTR